MSHLRSARPHRSAPLAQASLASLALAAPAALAQTWLESPGSNIFHTASNWSTGAAPSGTTGVAEFGASVNTGILVNQRLTLGALHFTSAATSPYFITFENEGVGTGGTHSLRGEGIVNDSPWAPTLLFQGAIFQLAATATLDDANIILNGGVFNFVGTGGTATIQMNGGTMYHAHSANGRSARLILNGGNLYQVNPTDVVALNFGSIEGVGGVELPNSSSLTVGQNNRDAVFSGTIIGIANDGATPSVTKVGSGLWSLVGPPTRATRRSPSSGAPSPSTPTPASASAPDSPSTAARSAARLLSTTFARLSSAPPADPSTRKASMSSTPPASAVPAA